MKIEGIVAVEQQTVALLLEAGQLLAQMGRQKQASDVFDGVGHLIPHSGVPPMLLGNLHFAKGKLSLAEKAQRQAVEREADRAACWAHLGEALLWGGKVEEGLEACHHAISIAGSDGSAKQFALNLIQAQELGCFDVEA
jgi:predicted Zn-dependent protease